MRKIADNIYKFSEWSCWISIVALSLMMLLIFFDVILRMFGYPIRGSYDIISLLCVFVIAIPIAYTQSRDMHISIDFIAMALPKKVQKVLNYLHYSFNMVLYLIIGVQSINYGNKLIKTGHVSETIKLPLYPVLYVISFASMMMVLIILVEFYFEMRKEEKK